MIQRQRQNIGDHFLQKLPTYYTEVKDLEKRMSVAIQQFGEFSSSCLQQIQSITTKVISEIDKHKISAVQQLKSIKSIIISTIEEQWQKFRIYARNIRKMYLGECLQHNYEQYPLQKIRRYLEMFTNSNQQLDALVKGYQKTVSLSQLTQSCISLDQYKEKAEELVSLTIPVKEQEQFKRMTVQSIQISPIKAKPRKSFTLEDLPEKDNMPNLSHQLNNSHRQDKLVPQKKEKNISFEEIGIRSLKKINNNKFNTQRAEGIFSRRNIPSPMFQNQQKKSQKIKTEVSIKKYDFEMIKLAGRVAQNTDTSKRYQLNQNSSSERQIMRSGLTRVKSDQNIKSGYSKCMEIIQRQQLCYDSIKQGLK